VACGLRKILMLAVGKGMECHARNLSVKETDECLLACNDKALFALENHAGIGIRR